MQLRLLLWSELREFSSGLDWIRGQKRARPRIWLRESGGDTGLDELIVENFGGRESRKLVDIGAFQLVNELLWELVKSEDSNAQSSVSIC